MDGGKQRIEVETQACHADDHDGDVNVRGHGSEVRKLEFKQLRG